ncbi:MAG: hypothetical protein K9M85_07015 [Candidatus Marinimicrobia bacterium]|nr:hypothetical protein [Candidatus Neomarinimicrobiota bacterium]
MSNQNQFIKRIFGELRNRRVFRVATVYLGVGFALLEAADIIVPMLGLPNLTILIVLAVLMLGFPIAVIMAWHYQMTPEGIRRSPKTGETQSEAHKPFTSNAIIIGLLVIIAALLAFPRYQDAPLTDEISNQAGLFDSKSIAVLPFTPFTKTVEDESFADGVHDDILTQLSKIAELKVISRTSVMQYKGTTHHIADIAHDLGVANVLEGSVRRAGDQIRIVAQLINAKTDEHLWAETYDREYADIFAVQSDVAKKIARALKAKLTPREQQYIETKPTENQEAWELYTRAELLMYTQGDSNDSIASALYDEASRLDAEFLLPVTRLARYHAYAYFDGSGTDPSAERLGRAKAALDKAQTIEPSAPETHMAQGYFYYYGSRDYEKALEEFYIAQDAQPNNSDLFAAIAYVERRLGRWEACWEHLEKAVSLDPSHPQKVYEIRDTARRMRKWAEAEKYQKRFSAIRGGNAFAIEVADYWISLDHYGDLEKLQVIYDNLTSRFSESETIGLRQWHAYITRNWEQGLLQNLALKQSDPFIRGQWLRLNGRSDEAMAYFDSARVAAERRIADNPEDWDAHNALGIAFAWLGEYDAAISWGRKAVEMMPISRDAVLGPEALNDLAEIYIACGEEELAIDAIETLLSVNTWLTVNRLKIMAAFDPLRDDPRFQALMKART